MKGGIAGLALGLVLVGCAVPGPADYSELVVESAPAAARPAPAHLTDQAFFTADGAALPLRVWRPAGRIKAVILAVHGFNDYSNAFEGPATMLAWQGVATYAYDQRGFGAAPLPGRWVGREQMVADLALASRLIRARHPGVPAYLLGESMGGALVTVAMADASGSGRPDADGIILAAPAVWSRQTMNVFERAALWAGVRLLPSTVVTGQGVVRVRPSDNIAMLRAYSRDPLVIKGARIDAIYGLVDLMDAALAAAPRLDVPLLYLYGEHDEIVPKEPTRLMIAHLPAEARARQQVAWYANGYHMLMRDLEAAVVVGDIASWITARGAPLPSGADQYATMVLGAPGLARAAAAPAAVD
jgi:alpha-beta hydrolase superfamily lysophospholipase